MFRTQSEKTEAQVRQISSPILEQHQNGQKHNWHKVQYTPAPDWGRRTDQCVYMNHSGRDSTIIPTFIWHLETETGSEFYNIIHNT